MALKFYPRVYLSSLKLQAISCSKSISELNLINNTKCCSYKALKFSGGSAKNRKDFTFNHQLD